MKKLFISICVGLIVGGIVECISRAIGCKFTIGGDLLGGGLAALNFYNMQK